jgi:acetylornithine deacetylase/succinyl-diaminopimelate desuccinylase-like protein
MRFIIKPKGDFIMSAISTWINELSAFTAPGEGVTRLPFTPECEQAQKYLLEELTKLGLEPRIDRYGTIVGHMEGKTTESIMLGSHYDSIPNGGKYDGIVGIVTAMDAIRAQVIIEAAYASADCKSVTALV